MSKRNATPQGTQQADGLAVVFEVGGETLQGRLPLYPTRLRYQRAYYQAIAEMAPYVEHDDRPPEGDPNSEEGQAANWVWSLTLTAALGLCWPAGIPGCPTLGACGYNIHGYGEQVMEALHKQGHDPRRLVHAGADCARAILDSIITSTEALKEAADPTEAQGATGTSSSSSSG